MTEGSRPGTRPTVPTDVPRRQPAQRSSPAPWGELVAHVFAFSGTPDAASATGGGTAR